MTSPWAIFLVFVASVAAFRAGDWVSRHLPAGHLSPEARHAASSDIAHERVLIVERNESSIPTVLLAVVVAWVILIYLGLGIFHVSNFTVNIALDIRALAFACAVAIVIELDTPYSGLIGVSTQPLERAAQALAG